MKKERHSQETYNYRIIGKYTPSWIGNWPTHPMPFPQWFSTSSTIGHRNCCMNRQIGIQFQDQLVGHFIGCNKFGSLHKGNQNFSKGSSYALASNQMLSTLRDNQDQRRIDTPMSKRYTLSLIVQRLSNRFVLLFSPISRSPTLPLLTHALKLPSYKTCRASLSLMLL